MSSPSANSLGALVRLAPWSLSEIPIHSSVTDSTSAGTRPALAPFILALLDEGAAFLSPESFKATFSHSGNKSAPPSTADVEVHKRTVPSSSLSEIDWAASRIPRKRPASLETETWFARRSVHKNISSKETKGSASWAEFVYGLRDEHSQHESDFTPTLYDAHHILDWNDEISNLEEEGKFEGRYSSITMSIYEMCHAIPPPLQPRCFSVLVITASTSVSSFMAVTVPIDLSSPSPLPASFYTSSRNKTEGKTSQEKKTPVFGVYTAVETVRVLGSEDIEWTMATASDAKGNLPMVVQKMSMPGAIPKDVSYFMDWIPSVSEEEVKTQKVGTH